jgi:CHAD domain-containing protein
MAYHLKAGESVSGEIRRIAREELESAADQLSGRGERNRDEAIHEARKSVKKIRAILRLVRADLGELYGVENVRLRDLGRKLSDFRDAGAILETFGNLQEKYRAELGRLTLGPVRRQLAREKKAHTQAESIGPALLKTAAALRRAVRGVNAWPLNREGFEAVGPGFEQTFRQGRKGLRRAKKNPTDENCHEWRKAVKYHWYHLRLLERLWTDSLESYEKNLKELETWLGDDHNLVVLRSRIEANPTAYGASKTTGMALELIAKYQAELRANSLSLGETIYARKPEHLGHHLRGVWDAWTSKPKIAKKQQKQIQKGENIKPATEPESVKS